MCSMQRKSHRVSHLHVGANRVLGKELIGNMKECAADSSSVSSRSCMITAKFAITR
jgi:hypothetical protein